jgi:hypothetical protein
VLVLIFLAACSAAPPTAAKPGQLTGGIFFAEDFAEMVLKKELDPFKVHTGAPQSISFRAGGKLALQLGQENESCDYKISRAEGLTLSLILTCDGQERSARWTWVDKDRATTDMLCPEGSKRACTKDAFVRLPRSFEDIMREYEQRFEAKNRPRSKGEWKDQKGATLSIADKGQAVLGGFKHDIAIVDCLETCAKDAPRTFCLLLAPPDPERHDPPKVWDDGVIVFVAQGDPTTLVEKEQLGTCPEGLAFSPVPDARVFSRAPGSDKKPR